MDNLTNALKIANVAFRTVRVMDTAKKVIGVSAAVLCTVLVFKFWRNK